MNRLLTGPLSIETLTVTIPGLAPNHQGLKLVQMSDFHFDGFHLSGELLRQAIQATNAAQPDLILLTGDYVTDDPAPIDQLVGRLKELQSRVGIYAVLGTMICVCQSRRIKSRWLLPRWGFMSSGIRWLIRWGQSWR